MTEDNRNPAAVALGALGASKGGKARAEKLSKKKLKEIAFVGSVYSRIARGIKVKKEDIERAEELKAYWSKK